MGTVKYFLNDKFIFPAFQVGFLLLTAFAWAKNHGFLTPKDSATVLMHRID